MLAISRHTFSPALIPFVLVSTILSPPAQGGSFSVESRYSTNISLLRLNPYKEVRPQLLLIESLFVA